jgi:ammonia channel protein AmtB
MVRAKNMLSVLMQVMAITCMIAIIWVTYGYSMAFTNGGALNEYVGGFSKVFLVGVTAESLTGTFSNGVSIYEYSFIAFQMTFACITPALIVGAFAERVKFSGLLVFSALWVTFVYFPIAHMVLYWAGPDAVAAAAKAAATATGAAKTEAEAALAQALSAAKACEQHLTGLRARLDDQQAEQPGQEKHLESLRSTHQRLRDLLKLRRLTADAEMLAGQVKKVEQMFAVRPEYF